MPPGLVGEQYCRPMPKPPQDPGSGPRIRARARGGTSNIRPEVADALGGVERSLSEVARWEQMLAGRTEGGGPVVPALPEGYVGLASEELTSPADPVAEAPPEELAIEIAEDPEVREVGILDAVRAAEEEEDEDLEEEDAADEEPKDAAAAADALVAPLLTEFRPEDAVPEDADASVLWAARTVEEPAISEEVIAKRRRHARILSWAGALILVAGAALWLVPDRSSDDDDELPAIDVTSTTRPDTNLLDQTDTTVPTTATTPTTTPSTTETTRRTATTARRAPATTAATSPPATPPNAKTNDAVAVRQLPTSRISRRPVHRAKRLQGPSHQRRPPPGPTCPESSTPSARIVLRRLATPSMLITRHNAAPQSHTR